MFTKSTYLSDRMTHCCVPVSQMFLRHKTIITTRKYMTFSISYHVFFKKMHLLLTRKQPTCFADTKLLTCECPGHKNSKLKLVGYPEIH